MKALVDALDPLLINAGFLGAQYGFDRDGGAGLLFCAAFVEFRVRYPWLPQADDDRGGDCTDLVIDLDARGLIRRVELEFTPVQEILEALGRSEAALCAESAVGATVADALPRLNVAISELFQPPALPPESDD